MERVVITGLGVVASLGQEVDVFTQAIKEGQLGITPIEGFDTSNFKVKLAAEIKNFQTDVVEKKALRRLDRHQQYALHAAIKAYQDAGLNKDQEDPYRVGVLMATGIGGLQTIQNEVTKMVEKGPEWISPFFIPMSIANLASGHVSIALNAKGISAAIVTACAASANAIGEAFRYLREGRLDVVVAGGTEASINEIGIAGFQAMQALSTQTDPTRASIPFDQDRSGFVMGEGSGALIMETLSHAKARGAKIYAEVVGYGATCDAYHITAPSPDGEGAIKAIEQALDDASIDASQVDYINVHGTSTKLNDSTESVAVNQIFGKDVKVSSTKSMTGHLLGAAGAIEALICVKGLHEGFMPPNINLQNQDVDCDVNIIKETLYTNYQYAMSNSLGFGGHNVSLIFKKWEDS